MRARDVLSKNVRALIDNARETRPALGSILKVAEESHRITHGSTTLSKSRVGRIVKGSHPTDIDALADLAEVFGLEPWQLLVENLNPKALPRLADSALLSQIKQIVDSATAQSEEDSSSTTDEHAVQRVQRSRPPKVGPALSKAFTGVEQNAGSRTAAAPKPASRRRR